MTSDIYSAYMQEPNFCCGGGEITGHQAEYGWDYAWRSITCDACDAEWHDIYTLTGYELVVAAKTGIERGQELLNRDFLPGHGGAEA